MSVTEKIDENFRQRDWCLTINNSKTVQEAYLLQAKLQEEVTTNKIRYFIMGTETAPTTGKQHLQCYFYWANARTFSAVKKDFPGAHIEPRKAPDLQAAADYCKKEGQYVEGGELPRNDKKGNVNQWKMIHVDIQEGMSLADLTLKYPEESIKYSSGIKNAYELHRPKHKFCILEKYGSTTPIQQQILDYVNGPTHDREIFWVYDQKGGTGKTDLANHLICQNNFLVFGNAKTADVALAWNGENVIFDYSRSQQDHINYGVIEDIKNGRIFSGKYQSCTKLYARPKVLVFANFCPDESKMSADRWNIQEVVGNHLIRRAQH